MRTFFAILLIVPLVLGLFGRGYKAVLFSMDCEGYLERAANANTIEYAIDNLQVALDYLDANDMRDGYTSVLWTSPDEDVGYWYNNLLEAYKELWQIKANEKATALEKSNILMKLRETLIKADSSGDQVISPPGITIYPNNKLWALLLSISLVSSIIGIILIFTNEDYF